ncbi:hypothetical protein K2173_024414 [Erythroxylum novogranatense]|uniref:peroxidase n=1 Tax=Erythroxylum novogranatense TaxID=1862640 RepID=A0AAV8SV23_9ROSI|nr:hypothetical protein K2173_024414 [Erythroxylum novogranatense]
MPTPILEIAILKRLSVLVFILCILISLVNQNAETKKGSRSFKWLSKNSSSRAILLSTDEFHEPAEDTSSPLRPPSLEYDFYRDSCPEAERIIHEVVRGLHRASPTVAPALLRLVFHDCFIEGCDASILLDAAEGIEPEKESPPNQGLRGFDLIDIIKSELEKVCPGVVSCADIVVLAAREGVVQAGGPFYPLFTGRKDATQSFRDMATYELPSPRADLSETLALFYSRGFDEREAVSLLGAHSVGVIHCRFFKYRIYNFSGTSRPDPSLETGLLSEMRSICDNNTVAASPPHTSQPSSFTPFFYGSPVSPASPSPSISASSSEELRMNGLLSPLAGAPQPRKDSNFILQSYTEASPVSYSDSLLASLQEPSMQMAYEGPGVDFGTVYYRSLLQGRGILFADQQLMAGEETGVWVRAYASDAALFRRDFALSMMKLSNLQVLTGSMGQVRLNCSKVD